MNPRALVATAVGAAACLLCATALSPLFEGFWWWFGPVLVATVVAVGTATLGRLMRLPVAAGVLLGLTGLVVTVTALCARDTAFLGLVPTGRTVETLRSLIIDGRADMTRLAAPVPSRPGLVVLTVIGVYVVVMIVDVIVVALNRPILAGLPLLGLFAVPAAVLPAGVGWLPFLLGALGYVGLLLLDGLGMVGRWGRPVTARRTAAIRASLGALGGRVALCALVLALAVPALLPTLDGHGVLNTDQAGGVGRGGPTSVVQPIVSLSQQLHAQQEVRLLTVRTNNPQYLRLTALENFDGQRFNLRALSATKDARISRGLPGPAEGLRTAPVTATIEVRKELNERYLPLPGIPTKITGLDGDWRLAAPTGTVFSTRTSTSGVRFQVQAEAPSPTLAELTARTSAVPDELKVDTALPSQLDVRLPGLVRTVTSAARNPFEQVYAIQEYLRGASFTYDLNGAPTTEDGALGEFLFTTRRGYCEQFAAAMAVMVRLLGIPARVAIGFTPGVPQADGSWLITNKQAHAWPEVWFPSAGWVPFEPTRRDDGATRAPAYAPSATDVTPSATPGPGGEVVPVPVPVAPSGGPEPTASLPPAPGQSNELSSPADVRPKSDRPVLAWLGWGLLALAVLAAVSLPGVARVIMRRRRLAPSGGAGAGRAGPPGASVDRVHAAWAELIDVAADLGIQLQPSDSPRAGAARLTAYLEAGPEAEEDDVGAARAALERLARAEERARYAPPGMSAPGPTDDVMTDIATAYRTLWSVAPRGRRAVATIAPPSVIQRVTRGGVRQIVSQVRTTPRRERAEEPKDWADAGAGRH
jgi:transglutaminase-like putative cysteine protease